MIISIALWVVFCLLEGIRDALTFQKGVGHFMKINGINLHFFLFLYRCFIFLCFMFFMVAEVPIWVASAFPLLFMFFHEGMYYTARKLLDDPMGYPHLLLCWFYSSKTTTAKFNFTFIWRLILFLIGSAIITYYYVKIY